MPVHEKPTLYTFPKKDLKHHAIGLRVVDKEGVAQYIHFVPDLDEIMSLLDTHRNTNIEVPATSSHDEDLHNITITAEDNCVTFAYDEGADIHFAFADIKTFCNQCLSHPSSVFSRAELSPDSSMEFCYGGFARTHVRLKFDTGREHGIHGSLYLLDLERGTSPTKPRSYRSLLPELDGAVKLEELIPEFRNAVSVTKRQEDFTEWKRKYLFPIWEERRQRLCENTLALDDDVLLHVRADGSLVLSDPARKLVSESVGSTEELLRLKTDINMRLDESCASISLETARGTYQVPTRLLDAFLSSPRPSKDSSVYMELANNEMFMSTFIDSDINVRFELKKERGWQPELVLHSSSGTSSKLVGHSDIATFKNQMFEFRDWDDVPAIALGTLSGMRPTRQQRACIDTWLTQSIGYCKDRDAIEPDRHQPDPFER